MNEHHETRPAHDPSAPACGVTFDRWRCGLPTGHDGHHEARTEHGMARWSDDVSGRQVRDLRRIGRRDQPPTAR